ncbi:MAG: RNA 2',3'-cyclic phosphodiesterase [Lachnospiraceae bacterium]|nr:RNA 2',3'-cyclic phosphodiesterase [Lachnospiraceae bacterium]
MRLFIAVQLSEEIRKSITDTLHELKKKGVGGSYVPKQNLHLTLAFIGEVEDAGAVKKALAGVSLKPFRLALSEMGTFEDLLWVGAKGNQGISGAAKAVRDALAAAGIPCDTKKFKPHITIVRKMSGNWKAAAAPKGEMMVKRISLMKSTFRDGKVSYSELWGKEL